MVITWRSDSSSTWTGKAETSVFGVMNENHDQMSAEIFKHQVKNRTAYRLTLYWYSSTRQDAVRCGGQCAQGAVDLTKPTKTDKQTNKQTHKRHSHKLHNNFMDTKFHALFHNSPSPEPDESIQLPAHSPPTIHRSTIAHAVQTSIQQYARTLWGPSSLQ